MTALPGPAGEISDRIGLFLRRIGGDDRDPERDLASGAGRAVLEHFIRAAEGVGRKPWGVARRESELLLCTRLPGEQEDDRGDRGDRNHPRELHH
jgi:hypothetical protein